MAIPKKDSLLVPFSENFSTRISATPTVFGLTATQATAYATLHTAYETAYVAVVNARAAGDRSKSLVTAKNSARLAALTVLRGLYGSVQSNPAVTDANKNLLGVTIRALPAPIPTPGVAPEIDIVSVTGRTVRIRLHDAADASRPKPAGVAAAAICSFVGPVAPSDPSAFKWQGSTGRSDFDIVFPESAVPGTIVWITAMWLNEKQEMGPACDAVSATIGYGMSIAA